MRVVGGTLRTPGGRGVRGAFALDAGMLGATPRAGRTAPLPAARPAVPGGSAVLWLRLHTERPPAGGSTLPVVGAAWLRGRFSRIEVNPDRLGAVSVYTAEGLSVRLVKR
ncbi:hypothetical protein AB0L59_09760 [Streptomyces sp. NPDC052109]|uniref:hypothetical protein n=1 Tax=Streptomyces sp. NPDC052109 TaxID=3155527 RepID=UPI00342FE2DF